MNKRELLGSGNHNFDDFNALTGLFFWLFIYSTVGFFPSIAYWRFRVCRGRAAFSLLSAPLFRFLCFFFPPLFLSLVWFFLPLFISFSFLSLFLLCNFGRFLTVSSVSNGRPEEQETYASVSGTTPERKTGKEKQV